MSSAAPELNQVDSWYEHRSLEEGREGPAWRDSVGNSDRTDHDDYRPSSQDNRGYLRPTNRPPSAIPSSMAGRSSWLAEVAAPPPIQNTDDQPVHTESHLEDEWRQRQNLDVPFPQSAASHPGEKPALPAEETSKLITEMYTISYLIFFSIMGTLARLGTEALTFYPSTPVGVCSVWVNFGGSLVLGFLQEDSRLFFEEWGGPRSPYSKDGKPNEQERKAHLVAKKTIPLYIGLATGFCGSYTSFSTFMRDAFLALSNDLPSIPPTDHLTIPPANGSSPIPARNGGYSVLAILAVLIVTIALSISALHLGAMIALALHPFTPTIPYVFARRFIDRTFVVLGWGCWLGAIIIAAVPPDRPGGPLSRPWMDEIWRGRVVFSLVFAPLGCLARFYASLHLNGLFRSFPLGTFACNTFGTAVLGMAFDLQRVPLGGRVGCQVLTGIQDGFCGCLTTVSTWVVELSTLRRKHAWTYGSLSVAVGLVLLIVIIGSLRWSVGFGEVVC